MKSVNSNHSSYLSVVLAYQMARVYGNNEPGAIRKCCRRIRNKTKNDGVHKFCKDLISCTNDDKLIGTIREVETTLNSWYLELNKSVESNHLAAR